MTLTATHRANYIKLLVSELRYAHNAWILDDAVLGVGVYWDFLADFGLDPADNEHRDMLRAALNTILREGF